MDRTVHIHHGKSEPEGEQSQSSTLGPMEESSQEDRSSS